MKAISVFKKAAIPALVLLLILAMTVSIIPMVSADDASQPKVAANTLAISGDITLVTYFNVSDFADAEYVTVTVPKQDGGNKTIKTLVADLEVSRDRYAVKAPLAAAQLTDTVTITWYKDGEVFATYERCAKTDYIDKVLKAAAPGNAYESLVAPLKSLLNYGAMAQAQFNHKTDSLANEGLYADANPVDGMTTSHLYDAKGLGKTNSDNIKFLGIEALYDSNVRLKVYFSAPEGAPEGATVTISDGNKTQPVRVNNDERGSYVNINNIASFNFDKVFTVKVSANGETATANCSVLGYALQVVDDYKGIANNAQKDTAKALYQFYEQSKAYSTANDTIEDNDYTVGPKDENGTPLTCKHTRTHTEGTNIVCSDCGVSQGEATRVGFKTEVVELTVGEAKDVTFTLNVAGKVDLSAIVVNLVKSENLTLIYKEGSAEFGNSNLGGEIGLNIEVDTANAITENCTLVTLTYEVTATAAGTYTITPVIWEAVNGAGNDIANDIVVSAATLTAKDGWCGNITGYDINATSHRAYCDECRNVKTAENHNFVAEKVVANGKLSINTAVCDVCDATGANNVKNTYTLGFELDADDNKTEKAPLFFLTPAEIAAKSSNSMGGFTLAEDGSYVTAHNSTKATGEGYFYVISGNTTKVTGRYLAIKYRTTTISNSEFFVGANNGKSTATAGENFYWNAGSATYVNNGEWHVAILDLAMIKQSAFLPEKDGSYIANHIRWDIFNDPKTTEQTVDIAYIAMSDDLMSLASFDGNDYYRVSANINASSVARPSYMGSTVTLNPVADAEWILRGEGTSRQTLSLLKDKGGLPYTHIVRSDAKTDCFVYIADITNPTSETLYHYAHTTDNAKYFAFIYRADENASSTHEAFVKTTGSLSGSHKFTGSNQFANKDNQWHIRVLDMSAIVTSGLYDPTVGMTSLRYDYWNSSAAEVGTWIGDLAFFGVFDSVADAYAYCGEYFAEYDVDCKHDGTTGWQFISNEGTEYEGTRYAVEAKKCAVCGEVVETRSAVVAANFDSLYFDGADGSDISKPWGTGNATKAGDMSKRVVSEIRYLRDNKTINGGGWAGINGLFSDTAYYRVLDKNGNVLLDWTAKGNSRVATNAGTAVQNAVNAQIGNNTLGVVSDSRRFTMNAIDLSAYASYYQAEGSRHENAPIVFEYALQAEGAPEGSDLVVVFKITNLYKTCTSHSYHNATVEENGKLTVYSECKYCGHVYGSYTMDIGNKAPNYFIGAADLADRVAKDSQVMSKTYTLSDDGSYVTVSNIAGKGDGYVNIFSGNKTVTGRYMVVKYRTTAGGGWQFYTGSNSSNPKPAGTAGDTFYLTGTTHDTSNQNRVKGGMISDGNWHYTIVDLAMLSAFKPYDDGSYMAQYFRWDIFDTAHADTRTTDVAYIAFADDIETLKAMDDMVTFQYAFKQYSGKSEAAVLPMSTTVGENNPFFDANHLVAKGKGLNDKTVLKTDAANGNMPYAQFTSTKTGEQYFDVWNNQNYKIAGSGKYIGVLYRAPSNSTTSFDFFVSSNSSGAVGGCSKNGGTTRDNQWRFMYVDISTLKTADGKTYYKDSEGLGQLRFDVLNGGMSATATIDIGFLGFFDDVEDMAATLTAYNELYGLNIPSTPLGITSNTTSIDANGTFDVTITEKVQNSFTSGTFNVSGVPSDATIVDATFGAGVTATIDGNNIVVTAIDRTLFDGTIANITFKTTYKTAGGDYTLKAAGTLKNGELTVSAWTGDVVNKHVVNVIAHQHSGEWVTTSTQHHITCTACGVTETGDHTYGNSTVTETAGVVNYVTNCTVCGYQFSKLTSESDRTPNVVVTAAELYNTFNGGINKSHNQFFSDKVLMQDEDGTGFIRFYDLSGNETTAQRQSYFYAYQATGVETGRYFVYRYRLPANGLGQTQFTIFTSTKNGGMTDGDQSSAPASERKDGEWYTVIIDLAEYGKTFAANDEGKYFAKYVRFDPFGYQSHKGTDATYVDIQFFALCDDLTDYVSASSKNTIFYNKTANTKIPYNQYNGFVSWDGSEKLGGKTTITEANGLTYNKYLSNSSSEQTLHIYGNATALTPVSDYLAIIYRAPKTVMSGGNRIDNKVGYAEVFIHSTSTSAVGGSSKEGSSYTKDGTWKVMVLDLTTIGATYDPATGMTSLRWDFFNGTADTLVKNGELHIAGISFVKNAAAGTAWYNEFLNEFYPNGQTEYVTPDVCTTENHYNRDGWVSAGVAEDGTLLEKTFCTCCNATMETRDVWFRGWMNGYYINDTKINTGNLYYENKGTTIDLAGKGVANTIKFDGWFATESGVHTYYYRVNGGEWIAFTNIKTYSSGNDGIANDVNKQNMGIDSYWTNSQFNGHLTTGDLAIDYAGQTVTLDFGFAPNNNPTAIQFVKTFKNLQVDGEKNLPTYVYLNNVGGNKTLGTHGSAFVSNTALTTSTSNLGKIYISGRVGIEGTAQKLVYRLLDANGNQIQGWQELDFYSTNNYTVKDITGTSHLGTAQDVVPEVTNVYEYVGWANITAFPGQTVTVECALVLDGVEGEAANYTFVTFENVTNTESAS